MRVSVYIDESEQRFKIRLEAENQAESSIIYKASNSCSRTVTSYGRVDENNTWAWFFIPITKKGRGYFGNDSHK